MIMFAVRPTYVQDSLFKMSSESPDIWYSISFKNIVVIPPLVKIKY